MGKLGLSEEPLISCYLDQGPGLGETQPRARAPGESKTDPVLPSVHRQGHTGIRHSVPRPLVSVHCDRGADLVEEAGVRAVTGVLTW